MLTFPADANNGDVRLLIQPRDGIAPLIAAIKKARKSIELVIFRFNRDDIERAVHAAVGRGVQVHALIAHTNHGGAGRLRKLELDKRREVGCSLAAETITLAAVPL